MEFEFEPHDDAVVYSCEVCDLLFQQPAEVTEEQVVAHYENGGFDFVPDHAFERVGDPCCPRCGSQYFEKVD